MDINVIVAKQGRDLGYFTFLKHLDSISEEHDVTVYVTSNKDDIEYVDDYFTRFTNIHVVHKCSESNRVELINKGLERMRCHCDVVIIMSIGSTYKSNFFNTIEETLKLGFNYILSTSHDCSINYSQIAMTEDVIDSLYDIRGVIHNENWFRFVSDYDFINRQVLTNVYTKEGE